MRLSERLQKKAIPVNNLPTSRLGYPYQIINGRIVGYSDNKNTFIDKAYMMNAIVYAVINIILDKVRVPQWGVYKVVDETALKQYKSIMNRKDIYGRDYHKALQLHKKAVELVSNPGKMGELLEKPNDDEEWPDFIANGCGYRMLTGDNFTFANRLKAGANEGKPQELINLAAQLMSIVASNSFPVRELGYILTPWQINFGKEDVCHEKYWNPTWSTSGDQLYGLSPLKAYLGQIQRNNKSVIAGGSSFDNMGIAGVLYVDDTRFDADGGWDQANAVKGVLNNEYTGAENKGKIATSGYKLGWQSIGLSPVDLELLDADKADLRTICNCYGVPSQLLNDPDNKIYNNVKEGEAALTARCAIPQLNFRRAKLNRYLRNDWKMLEGAQIIDYDPTCFTELNQSAKEVMEYLSLLTSISPNEERTAIGFDAIKEPWADEQFIKTGSREPISTYQSNQVDDELNNGAGEDDNPEGDE